MYIVSSTHYDAPDNFHFPAHLEDFLYPMYLHRVPAYNDSRSYINNACENKILCTVVRPRDVPAPYA